jgi:AIG2-like family
MRAERCPFCDRASLRITPTLIFAYGSNMDPVQMRQRCPGAEAIGNGLLHDHRLCFPRLSDRLGCGMASVEPAAGHEVWRVVYRLSAADLGSLDGFEGYRADRPAHDNRYNRLAIAVEIEGVPTAVQAYFAVSTDNPPPPKEIYLAHLRDGARHHGLPETYRDFLESLES